jgi:hypothetical protein
MDTTVLVCDFSDTAETNSPAGRQHEINFKNFENTVFSYGIIRINPTASEFFYPRPMRSMY